jgi:predicted amidohydrolase YtcJ
MSGVLIRGCSILGRPPCSVYIIGGRIEKIGDEPASLVDGTEVIDGNGGTLLPGLIDTHCHPFEYGWLKRSVDLRGTGNITGLRLRLQAGVRRAAPGEWVTGMGWDQEAFPGRKMPSHLDIDDISQSNPVALTRVCGHIAVLNSRAMRELNLASSVGEGFERDPAGALTGIVKEGALTEVFSRIPRSVQKSSADLQSVEAEAGRLGLTTLHCILSPEGYKEELEALAALESADSLALRYRVYVPPEAMEKVEDEGWRNRLQGDKVRINGVKIYADGSLGARTAALREPYSDDPTNYGMLRYTDEQLADVVEKADARGYQVIVHAIGDRAVEQAADALSRVAGPNNPRRHRIEHSSLVPGETRNTIAKHRIRATIQPLFVISDTWAEDRLGKERVRDLYPFRSMLSAGISTSGGSDSPVESLSPVLAMWAAMTRGGGMADEALKMDEALSLYTTSARSNGFDEATELKEGDPADLTLLDSDIEGIHPALFRKLGVLATIVGGSVVHSYGG